MCRATLHGASTSWWNEMSSYGSGGTALSPRRKAAKRPRGLRKQLYGNLLSVLLILPHLSQNGTQARLVLKTDANPWQWIARHGHQRISRRSETITLSHPRRETLATSRADPTVFLCHRTSSRGGGLSPPSRFAPSPLSQYARTPVLDPTSRTENSQSPRSGYLLVADAPRNLEPEPGIEPEPCNEYAQTNPLQCARASLHRLAQPYP